MPKIWVCRTTVNDEKKKGMALKKVWQHRPWPLFYKKKKKEKKKEKEKPRATIGHG